MHMHKNLNQRAITPSKIEGITVKLLKTGQHWDQKLWLV
jgi:hypothetical protein